MRHLRRMGHWSVKTARSIESYILRYTLGLKRLATASRQLQVVVQRLSCSFDVQMISFEAKERERGTESAAKS